MLIFGILALAICILVVTGALRRAYRFGVVWMRAYRDNWRPKDAAEIAWEQSDPQWDSIVVTEESSEAFEWPKWRDFATKPTQTLTFQPQTPNLSSSKTGAPQ